jgi:hypothetical protein
LPSQNEATSYNATINGAVVITLAGSTRDEPPEEFTIAFQGKLKPEEQAMFGPLIGNGEMKASAHIDIGLKSFGTGVSSSFSVSATCNQGGTAEDPGREFTTAAELTRYYALEYATQGFIEGERRLQQLLSERGKLDAYPFPR